MLKIIDIVTGAIMEGLAERKDAKEKTKAAKEEPAENVEN